MKEEQVNSKFIEVENKVKVSKIILSDNSEINLNNINFLLIFEDEKLKKEYEKEFESLKFEDSNPSNSRNVLLNSIHNINTENCKIFKKPLETILQQLEEGILLERLQNLREDFNLYNIKKYLEDLENEQYEKNIKNSMKHENEKSYNPNELFDKLFRKDKFDE